MNEPIIEFSAERGSISKALFVMQTNLGEVRKNASNPHFKSKYADLGAVAEAVSPALEKAKLTWLQGAAGSADGATVTVETMLLHESGEFVRSRLTLKPSKQDPQGAGSAITYARRYGLQSLCGICPEDDDANKASEKTYRRTDTAQRQTTETIPLPPSDGQTDPPKIALELRSRFNSMIDRKLPPEEVKLIIEQVQQHYGFPVTGYIADLHEGDEMEDAKRRLQRAIKDLGAA